VTGIDVHILYKARSVRYLEGVAHFYRWIISYIIYIIYTIEFNSNPMPICAGMSRNLSCYKTYESVFFCNFITETSQHECDDWFTGI
jgi:hypothetical protein